MNEQELKQIWSKEEEIPLKNIDMEWIQQYTNNTQNSLQKQVKKEFIVGIIASVVWIFIHYQTPASLLILAVLWIYAIRFQRRFNALDDNMSRLENVKTFLVNNSELLKSEVKKSRYFVFFGLPILTVLMDILDNSIQELWTAPAKYIIVFVITQGVVIIFSESYLRRNYLPILEDLDYLLEQFKDDDTKEKER